ncbi:IS1595 family transposase [Echinicola jeungdonensis]|uniref:IS1595 family transposase n=1 Tax=Echinicola jeungdonensis TaxID=709343 RepID=UPI0025B306F5|nr:IS1595 family transposase [Echinicola jeungdonensis]MDN3667758.1 IS1595 family transposase [Echinicola jeungdonensis]MDN3668023.1 IS1595 family transposase [Echinicola jeungdonensis]MDN3668930.1 IS1595 family transposase [Echinicola jeungdonensis]MDN3669888.1 IS1595 family transposase [Echinicola jeungdonensis]MDN3670363.1 IS1595 family transposase [Echinicola jeungdonensis]
MNIINFINRFPDESSCIKFIREQRTKSGIICKRCSCNRHYWLENKKSFQCASCGFRTSIKSGTVMENSNLPIRTWLLAMTFITATKKSFSASELQRQLGMKRYEPVFRMYHKLRKVMGQRDDIYRLEDMVEYDEAFVGKATKAKSQNKLKRGRGSQKQSIVAVMAESTVLENPESGKLEKSCRYFKMKKIKNLEAKTAQGLVKEFIDQDSVLQTDKSTTFSDLGDCIEVHVREVSGTDKGHFNLKWVHIAISNLKKQLQTYHMISERMMQNYLDEFSYKLNRKYFGQKLFDRLIIASIYPYWHDCG